MESIEEIECDTCRNIWMRYATLEAHLFYNLIESILNPEAYGIDDDARGHLEKYYWEASVLHCDLAILPDRLDHPDIVGLLLRVRDGRKRAGWP